MAKTNEQEYKEYLKKYSEDYRIFLDTDNLWKIRCGKENSIEIYSLDEALLCYSLKKAGNVRTKNNIIAQLEEQSLEFIIVQEGDTEK